MVLSLSLAFEKIWSRISLIRKYVNLEIFANLHISLSFRSSKKEKDQKDFPPIELKPLFL